MPRESEGRDAQPKGAEKPTGKETKHIAHITTHEVSTHTHTWLALGVFELPRARDPGHEPVGWRHGRRANNEEASGEVFPTGIPNPNFEGPRFQAGWSATLPTPNWNCNSSLLIIVRSGQPLFVFVVIITEWGPNFLLRLLYYTTRRIQFQFNR